MHKAHFHDQHFGMQWRPVNIAIAMLLTLLFLVLLFLFVTITATPANGQNTVPPTARQAASMPQYAGRLAHVVRPASPYNASRAARPTDPRASWKNPADPRRQNRRGGPLDGNDLYDNGPINGTTDAWTLSSGFVVSDTFTIPSGGDNVTGLTFGAWAFPGDVLQTVEISITSSEFGGTTYSDQVVNFTQSGCSGNQYGFNVCTESSGNFTGPNLAAGTYWINLQNAVVNNGDPIYWDENSGPSMASENSVGTIPSEAFTVLGGTTTTITYVSNYACPAPQTSFHDIRNFNASANPSGLTIDTSGRLYGALAQGGKYGEGLLYDLTQTAGHWFLSSLYSFLGGSSGSGPSSVIIGPGSAFFGSAQSDVQGCGYSTCGLIYEATPSPIICATALCSWDEKTIYQFTGPSDAWGGVVSAFDSAGNLYGISGYGGAYGQGAVFELTPSQGNWTETIVYSFQGGSDGRVPNSLLLGQDGNLYGTTASGGAENCMLAPASCGLVFQLVPSVGGWTENAIYNFSGVTDGFSPGGLIQDGEGDLLGFSECHEGYYGGCVDGEGKQVGVIFVLAPDGEGWNLGVLHNWSSSECPEFAAGWYQGLTIADGQLYAAEAGGNYGEYCGPSGCTEYSFYCGAILDVSSGATLVTGAAPIFDNLSSDANGNLYGTTPSCGFGTPSRTDGMVWQYSP